MPENFYAILTNTGKAKIANAMLLNQKVDFNELALGDGGGIYVNPTENQTALVNEIFRCTIGAVTIDTNNSNWIVVETAIAAQTGGFMIREAGIYDSEGDLLAVAKYPETYKPALEEGSVKDLLIRMILEVTNASVVTLKVDPTVILATKKDLERYSLLTHNHDERYCEKEEFDSQMAQDALNLSNHIGAQGINAHGLSGKIIHSAGSNANGEWIRFEDGTQICTRQIPFEPFTANTQKSYNVDYPAFFLGHPSITLNVRSVNSNNDFGINVLRAGDVSGSTFTLHGKFTVTQSYAFAYMAIGRWK